ncbi:MAG: HAD family phosphatase [Candidatus Bathyarchaeia archaeon]
MSVNRFKLVVFDLDGTLISVDSIWRFLHEKLNTWSKAKLYAEMFYSGKIDYVTWARLDVSLWRGIPLKRIEDLTSEIEYVENSHETVSWFKRMGFKVGVISAGLSVLAERAMLDFNLDFAEANRLTVRNGLLTGEVEVTVAHGEKDKVLDNIIRRFGIEREECIAIGDDESNISLFKAVGLGIAFNPTSREVAENADIVVYGRLLNVVSKVADLISQRDIRI